MALVSSEHKKGNFFAGFYPEKISLMAQTKLENLL